MTTEKKKWHSLSFHKNTNSWTLSENSYERGKHLKKFYTQDCKHPKQAASEVIGKVRELLGVDLVKLKVYSPVGSSGRLILVKTISFSGAANENTL